MTNSFLGGQMGIVDVWAAGCMQADTINEDIASGEPTANIYQCDDVSSL